MNAKAFFKLVVKMRDQQRGLSILIGNYSPNNRLPFEIEVDNEIERVCRILEQKGEKLFDDVNEDERKVAQ